MKPRLLIYFFKQAFSNILNNRMIHFIGLGTMVVSMLIFAAFLMLFVNLNTWIYGWGQSLSMSVYLKDGIDEAKKNKIAIAIGEFPCLTIKHFVPKEKALEDLKEALGSEFGILEGLTRNPLPASFELEIKQIESPQTDPQRLKTMLEGIDGVEEVQYSEDWLKQSKGLMDMVSFAGMILGGLLCTCIIFIVTNTIRLTIYSRKHEIEIKKLVGATDWFVKAPFLLEGIIQGILSGILAILIMFLVHFFLSAKKIQILGFVALNFVFLPTEYVILIFMTSVILGLAGSLIAIGRFISSDSFVNI